MPQTLAGTTSQPNRALDVTIDLWVLVLLIGLVSSKALLAIGMGGFAVTALYAFFRNRPTSPSALGLFLFPMLIFVVTLWSGLQSDNTIVWLDFVAKKLPFLILPLAFYAVRDKMRDTYLTHLAIFVIVTSLVSLGVLANYLMNFDAINVDLSKGKALNTPIDHTEFSIIVAYAAIVSLFLYLEPQHRILKMGNKSTFVLLSVFLTLFIHILAVRSGLVVYYLSMALLLGYRFWKQKKYKLLVGLFIGLLLLPLIAINVVPSIKKKVGYMRWDLKQYQEGKGSSYSDSERLYSLKAGWEVFKQQPVLGTGIGDLKDDCQAIYQRDLGRSLEHYPHNQYLFVLAGMGVVGFILYALSILGPVVLLRGTATPYFIGLILVVLLSGLVENTVERTFSIGFYLFFALSSYCQMTGVWAQRK